MTKTVVSVPAAPTIVSLQFNNNGASAGKMETGDKVV